jgi:hypothetical protein
MLGDKEKKQSLQGQLSTNWHKKEVSTLMDHFQGNTKKLAWFRSISGDVNVEIAMRVLVVTSKTKM